VIVLGIGHSIWSKTLVSIVDIQGLSRVRSAPSDTVLDCFNISAAKKAIREPHATILEKKSNNTYKILSISWCGMYVTGLFHRQNLSPSLQK
jgi:hypothetical protein